MKNMMEIKRPKLENVRSYRKKFHGRGLPTPEQLVAITKGTLVAVYCNGEKLWIEVLQKRGIQIIGRLADSSDHANLRYHQKIRLTSNEVQYIAEPGAKL